MAYHRWKDLKRKGTPEERAKAATAIIEGVVAPFSECPDCQTPDGLQPTGRTLEDPHTGAIQEYQCRHCGRIVCFALDKPREVL